MKYLLIPIAMITIQFSMAQPFVQDDDVRETIMKNDDEVKILYFTASWCKPCKYMNPIMESLDKDPKLNLSVYKMDIDQNKTDDFLKINSVPTFYYFKNGIKLGSSRGQKRTQVIRKMVLRYESTIPKGESFILTPYP